MKKRLLIPETFSHLSTHELAQKLDVDPNRGLSHREALERLKVFGLNSLKKRERTHVLWILFSQFNNPLIYLLLFAGLLSIILSDGHDAWIIFAIVIMSSLLSFFQKKGAIDTVSSLLSLVQTKNEVWRDGIKHSLATEKVVPGDIVFLKAGDVVPGDGLILDSLDFHVDEATLTGEALAVEKHAGPLPANTPLAECTNSVFHGTHIVCGNARVLIVHTSQKTKLGQLAHEIDLWQGETAFEQGIRHLSHLLIEITLFLVMGILAVNLYFERPFIDSLLFALALSIGLTPQLLPAIITINLAMGAKHMAKKGAIVKKLVAIENFGSMDLLCADKTGTITEGKIKLDRIVNAAGEEDELLSLYATLNAHFQTGYKNPIDQAILYHDTRDLSSWKKLDEIPYDFSRKRLSILVAQGNEGVLITKGAFDAILAICTQLLLSDYTMVSIEPYCDQLRTHFLEWLDRGFHVMALAYRSFSHALLQQSDESAMIFGGFLLFSDPPKRDVLATLKNLSDHGVAFKMITGDHTRAALHMTRQMGLLHPQVMTGKEVAASSDQVLLHRAQETSIFAEVEPNQKERIILALRKSGHVVGFLGDGINDMSAMHAADVSICVNTAADPVKEGADIVLLHHDLKALKEGVLAGRTTFANTLKYIFMATSANFGNMFSMAGASLFLSFLPLLPKQILAINLLTDLPEMTIATDCVDAEMIQKPLKWDIAFIKRFMFSFGIISSLFDFATFALLFFWLKADVAAFRTGWFLESLLSASTIVLVVRTFKPFYRSRPSPYLFFMVLTVIFFAIALPYMPQLASLLNLEPLPPIFFIAIFAIIIAYVSLVEWAKKSLLQRKK